MGVGLRWLGKTFALEPPARVGQRTRTPDSIIWYHQHDQLTGQSPMKPSYRLLAVLLPICGGCVVTSKQIDPTEELAQAKVRPGSSVLVSDSLDLMRANGIGLRTTQTGVNE